jgi:murein DD-endopeptidase MepM/ murein hydrolase activator NlpD
LKQKKTFTNWLSTRHQVVIRNEEDLAERSTFNFTYAKLITLTFFILTLFIGLSLFLSHTILRKWLNPAYIELQNNSKLVQLYTSVEKIEEKTVQQDKFIKLFQNMIEGKEEPSYTIEDNSDEQTKDNVISPDENEAVVSTDAALPSLDKNINLNHSYLASTSYQLSNQLADGFLFAPMEGIITTPFNPHIEHYGLDIVGKENEPIKSIADGTVILSSWTVETGWVIVVQHTKNLISVYKHNATLFKKAGNFVKSGDVIAIMGNSGEFSTGPHLHFELWYEGNPVNPENFITF